MPETRAFDTGDVLTAMTGRYCTPNGLDGVAAVLSWMVGEPLMTHQLPRVSRECEQELRQQHPDLSTLTIPTFTSAADGLAWLDTVYAEYGQTRDVARLPDGDHTSIDPLKELAMNYPNVQVIEVRDV